MNSCESFPYFLMAIFALVVTQPATASESLLIQDNLINSENRVRRLEHLSSTQISIEDTTDGTTDVANIFALYLEEIQETLPPGLIMRLPSQILTGDVLDGEKDDYRIQVFSSDYPPSLTVDLYRCSEYSPSCLMGGYSVDSKSSAAAQETLRQHQALASPITLKRGIQGYLREGRQQDLSSSLSSVMWEQDGMIYTARFLAQERQTLLYAAHSMANAPPIQSSSTTQALPTVDENEQPIAGSEMIAFGSLSGKTSIDAQASTQEIALRNTPRNSSSLALDLVPSARHLEDFTSDRYLTSAEYLQAQENDSSNNSDEADENPPELPADLDIDESGGRYPIGVIRPMPVLELQLNSSIFTNTRIDTSTAITESTSFLNSVALHASPELGASTRLTADVSGSLVNFTSGDEYVTLNTDLGILEELGDRMSLGLGWGYRRLETDDHIEDLSEHSVRLNWNRIDQLERRLFLNSGYGFRASFAQDPEQSRATNNVGLGLNYSFTPELQGVLGYRLINDIFFDNENADATVKHQLGAQLSYQINRDLFVGGSISYLFGESIDLLRPGSLEDLNNLSFGLHLGLNVPLGY